MLDDILQPGLDIVFVGTSVSDESASRGHYYAHPTNKFWQLLHRSGLTPRVLAPQDDQKLLAFGLGVTDLVKGRAASSDGRLAPGDYDVDGFVERVSRANPRVVAFNGSKAAEKVSRWLGHGATEDGLATWTLGKSWVYRLPSSSGSASIGREAKEAAWQAFAHWAEQLRAADQPPGASQ